MITQEMKVQKKIRNQIIKHLKDCNYFDIGSRSKAIKEAVTKADPNEIILVAGKGHEKYQEIKGERFPFDDMAILKEHLKD